MLDGCDAELALAHHCVEARDVLAHRTKSAVVLKLARRALPELKFHGMGLLTKKYGLTRVKAHAALADAQATAQLVTQVIAPRLRGTEFAEFAALVRLSEMERRRAAKALGLQP